MVEIAHQRRSGLSTGDVPRGAAHVDVDDVGASGLRDPRALRHPVRLAAGKLDHMWADAGRFAAQLGHRLAIHEVIAGGHLGDDKASSKAGRESAKGSVGDAGHRRKENPIGELNAAYFQWLRACAVRAGHGFLISLTGAPLHQPLPILSTNLVQSSFMPTL